MSLQSSQAKSLRLRLDAHLDESERWVEAIQRYLGSRIESVLSSLCLGFVQDENAQRHTRETLDTIYENATYLLYRVLFLFYAEARDLLPKENAQYRPVSLATIVEDARRQYKEGIQDINAFSLWHRLQQLCTYVDDGKEAFNVYPYDGGLFSDNEKPYLKNHKIHNMYLAPVLFHLAYMPGKVGFQLIDYRDLAVRHLGTLYESLLEYQLHLVDKERIVIRESNGQRLYIPQSQAGGIKRHETTLEVGEVYFADDKGERKSSGSYYTPEDVVQYIVDNTVILKLQECRAPLEELLAEIQQAHALPTTPQRRAELEKCADTHTIATVEQSLLKLRILDPAMGSAHFLVAAGQAMTNFIIETLAMTDWINDEIQTNPIVWKRRVVERCLYGVDLNPLAYELAKLALWLSSASKEKPLTFLNHHLKLGNTLYGMPRTYTPIHLAMQRTSENVLLQQLCEETIQGSSDELAKISAMDSNDIKDVKRKNKVNRIAADTTQPWRDIADVWLASQFKLRSRNSKITTEREYLQLIQEAKRGHTSESWARYASSNHQLCEAQSLAKKMHFFHWELEFPDAVTNGRCQFDAIIANPPYVGINPDGAILTLYETAKCRDLYAWILEQSLHLLGEKSFLGMIVPLSLMFSQYFRELRRLLLARNLHLRVSSYDNIPDSLFNNGKVSENTNKENSQRTTVVLAQVISTSTLVETTDLLRWRHEDRQTLFTSLHFTNTTAFCSPEGFPKIGNDQLVSFWTQFKRMKRSIANSCEEMFSEARKPPLGTLFLTVPRAARYFVSAIQGPMPKKGVLSLLFANQRDLDLVRVLLNSNVFYWYWRSFGDGFHLNVKLLGSFPIPDELDDEYLRFAAQLDEIIDECAIRKTVRGNELLNYNFNRHMDILLDIDTWIVRYVAPEAHLPYDIFAQYKSNSFLQPLSLPADTTTSIWSEA